jgi:signal transduction histidine kinase
MSVSTSFQNLKNEAIENIQYQTALLHLGQLALSDLAPVELMSEVAVLLKKILPVEYCLIWQLLDDGKYFLLMAGAGLEAGFTSRVQAPVDRSSMKGFTLTSSLPVVAENLRQETRFTTCSLNFDRVSSGVSVLIGTVDKPYGVIEVFSHELQSFSNDDIFFLQSAANSLGILFHKLRQQEDLVAENQILAKELTRAQLMTRSGHFEWDRSSIRRLIENIEKERLHLAQDLHDSPIQDLYGLIYQLDDLQDGLVDPDGGKIVVEFQYTLHKVVNSLRTICGELRPPSLSPFGLEVAIRDHVEKFCDMNSTIQVNVELMPDKQVLSDSLRLSLFRIYQQAIENVARHAEATEVHVRFSWDEKMIILEVEDNGKGFDVPKQWEDLALQDHFGLLGMAQRVESIGGKLEIRSAAGNGALIRTLVPRS